MKNLKMRNDTIIRTKYCEYKWKEELVNVIIEKYNLGNTRIKIDDTYKAKTEDERKVYIENFNRIGNEILLNEMRGETKDVLLN